MRIVSFNWSWVLAQSLIALVLNVPVSLAHAGEVMFDSAPRGAQVCLKKKGALECIGATPLKYDVEFYGENDSKRFYYKKLGYQTESMVVSAADKRVNATLRERDIFFAPDKQTSEKLKRLQAEINKILRTLIYGADSKFGRYGVEMVGQIKAVEDSGRVMLDFGLFVDNGEHRRQILAARRGSGATERDIKLARAILEGIPIDLLSQISVALSSLQGLDDIEMSVDYSVASAMLVDETLHYYRTVVSAQYDRYVSPGRYERVTEYTTTRYEHQVAKVEDELGVRTAVVTAPIKKLAHSKQNIDELISVGAVFLNDNRKKKFERVGSN